MKNEWGRECTQASCACCSHKLGPEVVLPALLESHGMSLGLPFLGGGGGGAAQPLSPLPFISS